ncbi:MAG: ADP-ribosylglycohydrolase family protein [Lachnospiraceae bacterium]
MSIYQDGIWGLVVADALGVPVEFTSRRERELDPVTGMRQYGTYNQPKGTWSDDSSMTLATLDSIKSARGIDDKDIMDKFLAWYIEGKYTPFGEVFDIGMATSRALSRYRMGEEPTKSGGNGEKDNGNGSLMRILPVCLYLFERQKTICTSEDESIYMIHNVSALTHGHLRSQMACGMYYFMVKAILEKEGALTERLQEGLDKSFEYYRKDFGNHKELKWYSRLFDLNTFQKTPSEQIRSSGYVVDTIEAAVWCLITTDSYDTAVLKAVNLGDDTDTVAAVTGGLAGLYYGYKNIPGDWLAAIQGREWIQELIAGMDSGADSRSER